MPVSRFRYGSMRDDQSAVLSVCRANSGYWWFVTILPETMRNRYSDAWAMMISGSIAINTALASLAFSPFT